MSARFDALMVMPDAALIPASFAKEVAQEIVTERVTAGVIRDDTLQMYRILATRNLCITETLPPYVHEDEDDPCPSAIDDPGPTAPGEEA